MEIGTNFSDSNLVAVNMCKNFKLVQDFDPANSFLGLYLCQAAFKMAPKDPHILVFMLLYNSLPWSMGWIYRLTFKEGKMSDEMSTLRWGYKGLWLPYWEFSLSLITSCHVVRTIRQPTERSAWSGSAYQQPHEWAWKLVFWGLPKGVSVSLGMHPPSPAFRWGCSLGWQPRFNLRRDLELEAPS